KALEPKRLKRAFATHLHSDHTAGYPDLILTPWVLERDEPLEVYGPEGIRAMTEHILAAYQEDIDERLHGLEPANDRGYLVNAHEIEPGIVYRDSNVAVSPGSRASLPARTPAGIIYRDSNVTVSAFPASHGSLQAYGYKFRTPGRTIVISGDTAPTQRMVEECRGCDVLIHEVYSVAGLESHAPEWQKYHSTVHTSSYELAEMASLAKPGLLILYHQLLWGTSEEELLLEIRRDYDGLVVSGKDLDVY
ncbi:MAG: MBL fold metallo-hydrolase, partial [Chloroflexota bacterium]